MTKEEIVKELRMDGAPVDSIEYDTMVAWKRCNQTMFAAADLIEQQTAKIKELEAKVPRWIPVTERLPEAHQNTRKSDAMLVYTRRKLFMVAVWNGIDWLAPMDFWDAWGDEIVYWMPLPEAPGGGTKWLTGT